MKNKKWGVSKVQPKQQRTYMTKRLKLKRKKTQWYSLLGWTIFCALVIYVPTVINDDIVRANLKEINQKDQYIVKAMEMPNTDPILPNFSSDDTMKNEVMALIEEAGLNTYEAYMIIQCESHWNPDAHGVNWNNKAGVDRGLFQISSLYHPEVSNACAYDPICNTKEAIRIHNEWNGWGAWSCGKRLGFN